MIRSLTWARTKTTHSTVDKPMKKQLIYLALVVSLQLPMVSIAQNLFPANGNVGIGTTSPAWPLSVVGDIGSTRDIYAGQGGLGGFWGDSFGPGAPGADITFKNWAGSQLGVIRNDGSVGIGTATPATMLDINGNVTLSSSGAQRTIETPASIRMVINSGENLYLKASGGGGSVVVQGTLSAPVLELTSDRNQKQDFQPVSVKEIANRVASMPFTTWAYTNWPGIRHIGTMAQDFKAAFPEIGEDDKHIGAGDGIGVALAAIKGLHELVQEQDSEIAALKAQNVLLQRQVAKVTKQMAGVHDIVAAIAKAMPSNGAQQANFRSEGTRALEDASQCW